MQVSVFHAFFEKLSLEASQDFTTVIQPQTSMLPHENKLVSSACQEMKLREQIKRLENDLIKARENQKAVDELHAQNSFLKKQLKNIHKSLQKEIENDLKDIYAELAFRNKKIKQLKNNATELQQRHSEKQQNLIFKSQKIERLHNNLLKRVSKIRKLKSFMHS